MNSVNIDTAMVETLMTVVHNGDGVDRMSLHDGMSHDDVFSMSMVWELICSAATA